MEEEREKKRSIPIDWDVLLPCGDDEPPPTLVVTGAGIKQPEPSMADDQQQQQQVQWEDIKRMADVDLETTIARNRRNVETLSLADGGAKLKARLLRLEDEKEHRKLLRLQKDTDGGSKPSQSTDPSCTCTSDGPRQAAPSALPPPKSLFASHFCRKLEDVADCRTVDAFEKDRPFLGRCDRKKLELNGHNSPRDAHKNSSSSRKSPFQCPSTISADTNWYSGNQNDEDYSEGKLSGSFSKRKKVSQVMPLKDKRRRNGQTVVLVDEEEPQQLELIEKADRVDEYLKEIKIYYPSRDDPESVEICYSDMDCLAPEAFLSSTIMNFYIRYLQGPPFSPTDGAKSDYHFFNTYFYKKLKEAVLNQHDQESAFAKFRRWWKGVNIFQKAYILVPIHENFLKEEWKCLNQGEAPLDLPIAGRIWRSLPRRIEEKTIAVPQQRNDYDCGLFVLFFMERFIVDAPQRLRKKDLAMFGKKWFKPEEASSLRWKINQLLLEEFNIARKDNQILDKEPPTSTGIPEERIVQEIDC